jgi:hypothetical protein
MSRTVALFSYILNPSPSPNKPVGAGASRFGKLKSELSFLSVGISTPTLHFPSVISPRIVQAIVYRFNLNIICFSSSLLRFQLPRAPPRFALI